MSGKDEEKKDAILKQGKKKTGDVKAKIENRMKKKIAKRYKRKRVKK